MKYDHLTPGELISYLELTNTDPLVRRLLSLLQNENIKTELIKVGMDPSDCEFKEDWEYYSPGEYIRHLRGEVDYYSRESEEWEVKYHEMEKERDRLKARSVANLLHEMEEQVKRAQDDTHKAKRIAERYAEENKELTNKINVWHTMST